MTEFKKNVDGKKTDDVAKALKRRKAANAAVDILFVVSGGALIFSIGHLIGQGSGYKLGFENGVTYGKSLVFDKFTDILIHSGGGKVVR